tara:strand:+ start:500 stop:1114 length:615 start_codon:yes stop_codon:yes gene_type:complete
MQRINDDVDDDMFQGRPIIHRDTPILGGVYLGKSQREAIVVDDSKPMLQMYQLAREKVWMGYRKINVGGVPLVVYSTVRKVMKFDDDRTDALIARFDAGKDTKISLGCFVKEGYGVCRHMALAAGYILEKFKEEYGLTGETSVDRNSWLRWGHAWARHTTVDGDVIIIDPAQARFGSLEDVTEDPGAWGYRREEDVIGLLPGSR